MNKYIAVLLVAYLASQTACSASPTLTPIEQYLLENSLSCNDTATKPLLIVGPLQYIFLGTYGNRNYFLEDTNAASQATARAACRALQATLVTFERREDLTYVQGRLPGTLNQYIWTDYINHQTNECFITEQEDHTLVSTISINKVSGGTAGLKFHKTAGSAMYPAAVTTPGPYVCMN